MFTAPRSRSSPPSTQSTRDTFRKTRRRGFSSTCRPGRVISISRSTASQPSRTRTEEAAMFSVIFEVHPGPAQWDAYLGNARMLRPELEQVDGFVDNVRYKSLMREGWILSLSGWRDEKAVVRWRTAQRHHMVQEKGRSEILLDYHLRVGEITQDTSVPEGHTLREQRLDETETGSGTTVILIDAAQSVSKDAVATA